MDNTRKTIAEGFKETSEMITVKSQGEVITLECEICGWKTSNQNIFTVERVAQIHYGAEHAATKQKTINGNEYAYLENEKAYNDFTFSKGLHNYIGGRWYGPGWYGWHTEPNYETGEEYILTSIAVMLNEVNEQIEELECLRNEMRSLTEDVKAGEENV